MLDEEIDMILDMGVDIRYDTPITSMDALLSEGYDAVFIGSGAPRGKNLEIPGRYESDKIHIGIDWLESVAFGHIDSVEERVLIVGAGNTAMDCCRTSKRIGGTDVKVMARKPRHLFKASDWELEDAEEERIEILENHSPERFFIEDGQVRGMRFEIVDWHRQPGGRLRKEVLDVVDIPCDEVILAIGQETALLTGRRSRQPVRASSSVAMRLGARRTSSGLSPTDTGRRFRFTTTATGSPYPPARRKG